jgi:hypothetical protein
MIGEINIYGVFIPSLLAWSVIGFIASIFLRRVLAKIGFYKYVWHRPLFDIALVIVLVGAVSSIANRIFT